MNNYYAFKEAVLFFVIILMCSLLSALLGGGFGALVAGISPEFVRDLFCVTPEASIIRYSFAVGMIWGLFIGAAVAGFGCLLAAIIKILRIRLEVKGQAPDGGGRS